MKRQSAPWGDPLMLENPGDELYFGEVYRQILQEAWLPDGGEEWHRLGKSRRGYRPAERGLTSPPLSPEQAAIRQCFSDCAAAWRELPWELPFAPFCDNRQPRKYWHDEKARRGVMCSYYDLYMRYCMRFCLDTGCLAPVDYFIKVEPPLTDIECNKVYSLDFTNACGDISMVSGDGFFVPPNEWVSPKCGDTGQLCFQDANGSKGWTSYTFSLAHRCTQFIWPAYNPGSIAPNTSKPIYVEGGVSPYNWTLTGAGFSLAHEWTTDPVNTLHAAGGSCGSCKIDVIDICGNECDGWVLSTAGQWLHKQTCDSQRHHIDDYCGGPDHTGCPGGFTKQIANHKYDFYWAAGKQYACYWGTVGCTWYEKDGYPTPCDYSPPLPYVYGCDCTYPEAGKGYCYFPYCDIYEWTC